MEILRQRLQTHAPLQWAWGATPTLASWQGAYGQMLVRPLPALPPSERWFTHAEIFACMCRLNTAPAGLKERAPLLPPPPPPPPKNSAHLYAVHNRAAGAGWGSTLDLVQIPSGHLVEYEELPDVTWAPVCTAEQVGQVADIGPSCHKGLLKVPHWKAQEGRCRLVPDKLPHEKGRIALYALPCPALPLPAPA